MLQETLPDQRRVETGAVAQDGLFHRLIAGNYFYFLSAALMLLGCCLLMHSSAITGDIFTRTLKTLFILQGYELLVIVTALAIVWRFRLLDDAFSLLLVELLLLLDPTFFSNSFFTMPRTERTMLATSGVMVNVACFALVPLKLLILQAGLRLRFSAGCWVAFIFAAAFAYLAEAPLCRRSPLPGISPSAYHYLLAWAPLVFAALLPPLSHAVKVASTAENYISPARLSGLRVLLLLLPLAVIFAHLLESACVHELTLHLYLISPLILGILVLVIRQSRAESPQAMRDLMFFCDVCMAAALVFASGWLETLTGNSKTIALGRIGSGLPHFASIHLPLISAAAGVAAIYLFFFFKFRYRPALYRLLLLVLAGTGAAAWWFAGSRALIVGAQQWLSGLWHATANAGRHGAGWLTQTLAPLGRYFTRALDFTLDYAFEILQGLFFLVLLGDHCRKKHLQPENRFLLGALIALLGLIRFGMTPAAWSAGVCGAEILIFLLAGALLRPRGYLVIAAFQACVMFLIAMDNDSVFSREVKSVANTCAILLRQHPQFTISVIWFALLGLALGCRNIYTWFTLGLFSIWIATGRLPGGRGEWIPEIIQSVFIMGIVLDHRFGHSPARAGRYTLAVVVALIAGFRFADRPTLTFGLIGAVEACAFVIAGVALRHPGYLLIALLEGSAFTAIGWDSFNIKVTPAMLVIASALASFAIGIAVTFNKNRLLNWVNSNRAEAQTKMAANWLENIPAPQPPPESPNEPQPAPKPEQDITPPEPAPSTPPPPSMPCAKSQHHEELRLRATVAKMFNSAPPFEIALTSDLTSTETEAFKAGSQDAIREKNGNGPIYLIKGDPRCRCWTVVPAWICYPAEPAKLTECASRYIDNSAKE